MTNHVCPVVKLFLDMRDVLDAALDVLERDQMLREKNRNRMRFVRAQKCACTQETERQKEEPSPHTPYKEKEEKEKECSLLCARAGDIPLPAVIDFSTPPTLQLLLAYAHKRVGFFKDDFTREYFRTMNDELNWRTKDNKPIGHWGYNFRHWRENEDLFKALHDPKRVLGTKTSSPVDKAGNHLTPTQTQKDEFNAVL